MIHGGLKKWISRRILFSLLPVNLLKRRSSSSGETAMIRSDKAHETHYADREDGEYGDGRDDQWNLEKIK